MRRTSILLCFLLASPALGAPGATLLTADEASALGPAVHAGDLRACSARFCVVIAAKGHAGVGSPTGGQIAWLGAPGKRLPFGALHVVLDAAGLRAPDNTSVAIVQPGGPSQPSIIRARGTDPVDDQVEIIVDYVVDPGADTVRIVTSASNRGRGHYADFALGYFAGWGQLDAFVPDSGTAVVGRRTQSEWVGAEHAKGAIAIALQSGRLTATHGAHWSALMPRVTGLRPGDHLRSQATVYIQPAGGLAAAVADLRVARKSVSGEVRGTVKDGAATVAGAWVTTYDAGGRPALRARADESGQYVFTLRPGDYTAVARAPGRAAGPPKNVRISADKSRTLDLLAGAPGQLEVIVRVDGEAAPYWLRVTPEDGGRAALHRTKDGRFKLPLAPGSYRLQTGAGPNFGIETRDITLAPGTERLELALELAFVPLGWFSLDPLLGVEVGVAAHDAPGARTDYCASMGIEQSGLLRAPGGGIAPGALGYEVAVREQGKWAAWPTAAPLTPAPRGLNAAGQMLRLKGLGDDPLIAVLAPRAAGVGYFRNFRFDPAEPVLPRGGFTLDFDLLDVGGRDRAQALKDYFGLLQRGQSVVPIAGSGARSETDLCGAAFTWVRGAPPAETTGQKTGIAALRSAIARNDVVASNGPLIDLRVNGASASTSAPRHAADMADVRVLGSGWAAPTALRVFADGKLVSEVPIAGGPVDLRKQIKLPEGAKWVVATVSGRDDQAGITGRGGVPFAVTSPVWFEGALRKSTDGGTQ